MTVTIRPMSQGEERSVSDLVVRVFRHDVAPLYALEGIEEFVAYASAEAIAERQFRGHDVLVAIDENRILGALELRDRAHVSLLFVEMTDQRKGLGRLLVAEALRMCRARHPAVAEVTVNSSPNSVDAYVRYGFHAKEEAQVKNGIAFVPMAFAL
jgi:predicted GNAT family N-acyltransferase